MTMARRPGTRDGGEPGLVPGYRDWWSVELRLWWRDFDALGHLTASAYSVAYQEAFAGFVEQTWHDSEPSYVVTRMSVDWYREVRRSDSPIRVYVAPRGIGRSSFEAAMVLCSADGRVCSTAETHNAAWDRERRRSRPLTEAERSGLLRHVVVEEGSRGAGGRGRP